MKINEVNTVQDIKNYVDGCLNDFDAGISTKQETSEYLGFLCLRIIELKNNEKQINN